MKKYIGTKTIMAMPMAKSEAEKVLNRSLADAKGGEDGYLVEYPDGYKSWSPKETFEEAYKVADTYKGDPMTEDFIAYLKLRIIVAALNEGWEPKFEKGEYRYFPWFYLYTKEQYDELDDEEKGRCVLRSGFNTNSSLGFVSCFASYDASFSSTSLGSRLAFRTRELAAYAGRQFTEEWADFMFKPRTGEELNGKSEAGKTTIDFNNKEDE